MSSFVIYARSIAKMSVEIKNYKNLSSNRTARVREKLRILIKHDDQHENVIKLIFLYRNQDPMQRKEYVKMHDDVIEAGGDVKIFSSMHVSGERKSHFYCV